MTPAGLVGLRLAATVAHFLPSLRVRIRHQGTTLLEVARVPGGPGPAISPCAFRAAVAKAHQQVQIGVRLAFMGLDHGVQPAVDIGVRTGDAVLPGGIYRVTVGDDTIHGFATTLSARSCRSALVSLPELGRPLRLHHDPATDVSFVHTSTPTAAAPPDAAHLEPVMGALLVEEVERVLAGTTA